MGKNVYAVTSGEYSAYHVVAVYSNKAAAEAHVEAHNRSLRSKYDFAEVEVWPLYSKAPVFKPVWKVPVPPTGEVHSYDMRPTWEGEGEVVEVYWDTVESTDLEKATKVAHDRAAQLEAEKAGL